MVGSPSGARRITSTWAVARKPNCPSRFATTDGRLRQRAHDRCPPPGRQLGKHDHRRGLIACAVRPSTHDRPNISRPYLSKVRLTFGAARARLPVASMHVAGRSFSLVVGVAGRRWGRHMLRHRSRRCQSMCPLGPPTPPRVAPDGARRWPECWPRARGGTPDRVWGRNPTGCSTARPMRASRSARSTPPSTSCRSRRCRANGPTCAVATRCATSSPAGRSPRRFRPTG